MRVRLRSISLFHMKTNLKCKIKIYNMINVNVPQVTFLSQEVKT